MTRIVVCSGEPSGDAMVCDLVPALRERFGTGLRLGVVTSSPLDCVNESEVLCAAPEPVLGVSVNGALRWKPVLEEVWKKLAADPPDLFIAISHHGFNLILAAELKALEGAPTKTLMVAPPEVWAWDVRSGPRALGPFLRWAAPRRQSKRFVLGAMLNRGRSTLRAFDGIACLMEPNLKAYLQLAKGYDQPKLVVKVGHAFARYADPSVRERVREEARALRATLAPAPDDLLIGLFPGSREAEVERLLPTMLEGLNRLRTHLNDGLNDGLGDRLKLVVTASDERREVQIRSMLEEASRENGGASVSLVTGRAEASMGAADYGLLCSGTVTLLAASLGLPSIVVYDRGWSLPRTVLVHLLLRKGRVSPERGADKVALSLPSAVVGEQVFPELAMRQCTPERVAMSLEQMIDDEGATERIRRHQERLLALLQPPPPSPGYGKVGDTPMQRVAQVGGQLLG